MKKQHIIIILVAVVVLLVALFLIFKRDGAPAETVDSAVPTEEALDAVVNFYNDWVETLQSTSTTLEASGLLDSPLLSSEVKNSITTARASATEGSTDPVTCQTAIPDRMGGKAIFSASTSAEIMMLARGFEEKSPFQAVVSVTAVDGNWQITKIACTQGEVAPEREFDFEREGFLLKSVPPPLNPNFWYLVYEENGQMGRTVPLTITPESICVQGDGTESPCNESMFGDAMKVYLRADMSEAGATIRRLEF